MRSAAKRPPWAALAAALFSIAGGWWQGRGVFLAAYLAAWWFCVGLVMGGLANVWIHNLTGGAWGELIRGRLLELARGMWLLALLFLPVLLGMRDLYPWAAHSDAGIGRWAGELAQPAFKSAWLMPWFFALRGITCLAVWCLLAHLSRRPALSRSPRFAAFALIAYGVTVSIAAMDWMMSLLPLWYSSVFGLLAAVGQMLTGLAGAVALAARESGSSGQPRLVFRDLGNLLLMYVMTWAYLAFCQFLIIWSENLPHEIIWYAVRMRQGWLLLAWVLAVFHFFAPLLILLFRQAKEAPRLLALVAFGLLAVHLIDVEWMILPSVPAEWPQWSWTVPVTCAVLAMAIWALLRQSVAREEAHG